MPESDEDLMRRLSAKDDETALVELMNRYQDLLANHFAKRGVSQAYEDLAQETFFKIYKARKRYRPTAAFRTWMFKIAERVWIDHVRKSSRRQRREDAFRNEPAPTSVHMEHMLRHDISWALERLPIPHREVVVHAALHQLSHQEIALRLGIPRGTVKSRLHSGLRKLRTILEEDLAS